MENKNTNKQIATNLRDESTQLLGSINQCVNNNLISENEAKRLRSLIYEFYNLSYNIEKQ